MIYKSKNSDDTKKIASIIAGEFRGNRIFTLKGELGAGKTTFVQGFAKALRIKDKIISPTFVLIRQHKIPQTKKTLFHIDLYRLEDTLNIGLEELLEDPNAVILIEWPEKLKQKLPEKIVKISIIKISENIREIKVD